MTECRYLGQEFCPFLQDDLRCGWDVRSLPGIECYVDLSEEVRSVLRRRKDGGGGVGVEEHLIRLYGFEVGFLRDLFKFINVRHGESWVFGLYETKRKYDITLKQTTFLALQDFIRERYRHGVYSRLKRGGRRGGAGKPKELTYDEAVALLQRGNCPFAELCERRRLLARKQARGGQG